MTWNVQWGRGTDGRVDLARTAAAIADKMPDVVCLQEVARFQPGLPGGADADQVGQLQQLLPGFEAVYGAGSDLPGTQGRRRQFGNLVLSRLPILQAFRHLLPWPHDPSQPSMQRVAVEVVIDTSFGALRVTTTHLEYYSAIQRMAQVEALRGLHAEAHRHAAWPRSSAETDPPFAVLPRGEYAVVCGDFNALAMAMEHARMQASMADDVPALCDAWHIAHPNRPHDPTAGLEPVPWLAGPACVDFFYVSANLAARVAAVDVDSVARASDHQPVLLELREN